MKRQFVLLVTLFVFCHNIFAYDVEIDGVYYNIVSKVKTAEVTSGEIPYSGAITIPSSIEFDGEIYSVAGIGDKAFYDCIGLTSVIIPNSVLRIGMYAFYGCSGLKSVSIPGSVTSIESFTFCQCRGLVSVVIPNSITRIGSGSFNGCSGLTSINIPNSVTSIGSNTFCECSSLTSVTLPTNISFIGVGVFDGCSSLTSVTIPKDVTNIEYRAFSGCKALRDVYCFAETVPKTNDMTFQNTKLEYATLHVPPYSIDTYGTTLPWSEFGAIVALNIEIPNDEEPIEMVRDGMTYSIDAEFFETILVDVEPNDVLSILETIEYDSQAYPVASIETGAFSKCSGTTALYVPWTTPLSVSAKSLDGLNKDTCTLYVPKGSLLAYARATGWGDFLNIVEVGAVPADVNGDGVVDSQDVLEIYDYMQNN